MMHMQMAMFMKNLSMLGGALLVTYFGAGALSLDASQAHYRPAEEKAEEHHKTAVFN